ncbi:hypothetical protein L6452_32499 [Arctium lappa]|uniref:Uncharacterized protein n=1 Tax=Arctium lappa TaxID=4217 RepID=A0ACB8Z544_ARCLA|nr:hypothetical protein L6452_32499 [Arctium lappa]
MVDETCKLIVGFVALLPVYIVIISFEFSFLSFESFRVSPNLAGRLLVFCLLSSNIHWFFPFYLLSNVF